MVAGEHQTFDREALLDRLDGDLRLAHDLITTYLEESPAMHAGLRAALESNEPSKLERVAHTLRGTLATVSAPAATRLADQLETSSRDGDLSSGRGRAAELEVELDLLEQTLRTYLREAG